MLERLLNIFPGQVGHAAKQNLPRQCIYAWRRRVYCESSEFCPPRAQLLMLIMLLQQLYTASASAAEGRGLAERLCQASLMAAREISCSEKPIYYQPLICPLMCPCSSACSFCFVIVDARRATGVLLHAARSNGSRLFRQHGSTGLAG